MMGLLFLVGIYISQVCYIDTIPYHNTNVDSTFYYYNTDLYCY